MNNELVKKYKTSTPIDIPQSKVNKTKLLNIKNAIVNSNVQDIKLNLVDPNNCSPPNSWNSRLLTRMLNM